MSEDQRVGIASLFLIDRIDAWYHNWKKNDRANVWEEFENKKICVRDSGNLSWET